jgi:hypothetical protein
VSFSISPRPGHPSDSSRGPTPYRCHRGCGQ